MLSQRAAGVVLVVTCTLTACTSLPPPLPGERDWQQHSAQLAAMENWHMSGKLAVRTNTTAESVRINWSQTGGRTRLVLSGPIGWGRTVLIADKETLSLERNGHQQTLALDDLDTLERELGWALPAALLPYWIKGLPAPGIAIGEKILAGGRLLQLRQSGWSLRYEQYQQVGQLTLPARITFQGETASGKIIIKQWTLDAASS